MSKPLVLVDGSSYLYRAFHALPPLANSEGHPTGAIYGVVNMIKRLLNDYHPEHMAIVFDAKGKTFRHRLYHDYKSHRPPMPDELVQQIKPLHDIIRAIGIPLLIVDDVEADDVIGTLTKIATKHHLKTIISASDKDLAQLVDKDVTLIDGMSNTVLDIDGVKTKFGVAPEQMIDYLTLIGDTSDNIPGVDKVGPKTAVKWLEQYGSLDEIIKHADEIKGVVGENLRNSLDQIALSKQLVIIKCDLSLDITPENLIFQNTDVEKLTQLFKKFELRTSINDLVKQDSMAPPQKKSAPKKYHTILNHEDFDDLVKNLKTAKQFAIDTETTSLNYMQAEIVGLSFAIKSGEAFYIPMAHHYEGAPKQLDRNDVLNTLKPLLENESIKKIGQHIKYDKEVLANYDIDLKGIAFDTMLESYVIDANSRHDLSSLAFKYLNLATTTYEDIAGRGAKQISFSQVAIDVATDYSAKDADVTLQLHEKFWPQIEKDKNLKNVLCNIEMPLLSVLAKIERYGVLVDVKFLKKISAEFDKRMEELEAEAFNLAGEAFNLNSPKQLQEVLYDKLKLPVLKKTVTKQASTAEPILQELALDYPLPKLILEYRSLSKLKSTYADRLPEQIEPKTNRVHTSYHQAVTSTGRLSSSDPNLQNIPIRSEGGRRIRQAFIAPKGYKILAADYSQIELRIMAHLSKDKKLLEAFDKGLDIHKATAANVFAVKLSDVTADQRRKAKAINFGLLYGMSAFGLSKQLGIERAAAQAYMDAYFAEYPAVHKFMEDIRKFAHQHEYVETLFCRRLYTPNINSRNIPQQKGAERAAINAPMQGTAADIIKIAMINVDDWISKHAPDIHMIMQVHDELVFEVPEEKTKTMGKHIKSIMEEAADLDAPLVVEVGIGDNWDEAH